MSDDSQWNRNGIQNHSILSRITQDNVARLEEKHPFIGYRAYKIFHKKEGRLYVCLVGADSRTTIAYAKYVLSIKLGRWLAKEEQVDHIDNNRLNDVVDNLQILSEPENRKKYVEEAMEQKNDYALLICPNPSCGKLFERERRKTHLVKHGVFTSCSRRCAGIIRQSLQEFGMTDEWRKLFEKNVADPGV